MRRKADDTAKPEPYEEQVNRHRQETIDSNRVLNEFLALARSHADGLPKDMRKFVMDFFIHTLERSQPWTWP